VSWTAFLKTHGSGRCCLEVYSDFNEGGPGYRLIGEKTKVLPPTTWLFPAGRWEKERAGVVGAVQYLAGEVDIDLAGGVMAFIAAGERTRKLEQ